MSHSVVTTIVAVMGVIAIFLFTFGIPWHANFFQDFNVAKDSVVQFAAPISAIGDALRSTYNQVQEAQIFFDNYEFWQGKISQWAYKCGLKNPYEMSVAECTEVFSQFDEYVVKAFGGDEQKARQFIFECSRYVYFVVYKNPTTGEHFFTYTYTTRPGQYGTAGILVGIRPDVHWLFQFVDEYSWFDLQKVYQFYDKGVQSSAVCYKELLVEKDGKMLDFYVMTPFESVHGHKMLDMQIVDVIPMKYRDFKQRCDAAYPDVSLEKFVITDNKLKY